MNFKDKLILETIRLLDLITLGSLKEAVAVSNFFSNDVKRAVRSWNTDYKTNCYVEIK